MHNIPPKNQGAGHRDMDDEPTGNPSTWLRHTAPSPATPYVAVAATSSTAPTAPSPVPTYGAPAQDPPQPNTRITTATNDWYINTATTQQTPVTNNDQIGHQPDTPVVHVRLAGEDWQQSHCEPSLAQPSPIVRTTWPQQLVPSPVTSHVAGAATTSTAPTAPSPVLTNSAPAQTPQHIIPQVTPMQHDWSTDAATLRHATLSPHAKSFTPGARQHVMQTRVTYSCRYADTTTQPQHASTHPGSLPTLSSSAVVMVVFLMHGFCETRIVQLRPAKK